MHDPKFLEQQIGTD